MDNPEKKKRDGDENDLTKHASKDMHKMGTLAKGARNIGAFSMTSNQARMPL